MVRFRTAAIGACVVLAACSGEQKTEEIDVTPRIGTGAAEVRLPPPATQHFDGVPQHIGFEPVPLEEGDFPLLTSFVFLPNSMDFLAVNRYGKVGHFRMEENRAAMIDSFQIPAVFTGGDCAASSIALDPDFAVNKLFYVGYCIDAQYNVVKRYTMSDKDFSETLYTAANVIAVGDPKADIPQHAVGTIAFSGNGIMWVNIGERRRDNNAQDITNELGKVIRLVPLKQSGISGYSLPDGNAFPDQPPNSPLIYAYGLRNPWRGVFDSQGRYWIADVGSTQYEEINVITKPGQNFGWPLAEGPLCRSGDCSEMTAPVRFWDVSPTHQFMLDDPLSKRESQFHTSWVGLEYQPGNNDRYGGLLNKKMLYGDFYAGYVRGVSLDAQGKIVSDQHLGHIELPTAWRQGKDGYIYVGTMLKSFDRDREGDGDGNLLAQSQQGQLWRAVPLP